MPDGGTDDELLQIGDPVMVFHRFVPHRGAFIENFDIN
jgi:hypothetical protein